MLCVGDAESRQFCVVYMEMMIRVKYVYCIVRPNIHIWAHMYSNIYFDEEHANAGVVAAAALVARRPRMVGNVS